MKAAKTNTKVKRAAGLAQPEHMSQAEQALKERSSGAFDSDFAWHQNCVFDLNQEEHGINLYVFADGSAFTWDDFHERSLPREEVVNCLSDALHSAYRYCLDQQQSFVLWIEGERFADRPQEAFEAVLRLLDPPLKTPERF